MSKASEPVRALAHKEMLKAALNPRESVAMLRLAGQTFTSLAKKKLKFSIAPPAADG